MSILKRVTALTGVLALCWLPCAVAQSAPGTQAASTTMANALPDPDKDFVQKATMANSTEIDASEIVLNRSADKDVKSFARTMMLDHTQLTVQLKLAAPHGVAVPKDNSDMAVLDMLKAAPSAQFNRLYIQKIALQGHKDTIAAFNAEIANGQNDDLKTAANKALPTIEQHYQMAVDLAKKKGVATQ